MALRWLGGTFTNWTQIKSRIDRLVDLKSKREKNELGMYTKKERLLFDKEIARLDRYVKSWVSLKEVPGGVVVIDSNHEHIVVAEAAKVKVPVVSLSGSDCDLAGINYPVVANDANVASIKFFLDQILAAYEEGRLVARQSVIAPAVTEASKVS